MNATLKINEGEELNVPSADFIDSEVRKLDWNNDQKIVLKDLERNVSIAITGSVHFKTLGAYRISGEKSEILSDSLESVTDIIFKLISFYKKAHLKGGISSSYSTTSYTPKSQKVAVGCLGLSTASLIILIIVIIGFVWFILGGIVEFLGIS